MRTQSLFDCGLLARLAGNRKLFLDKSYSHDLVRFFLRNPTSRLDIFAVCLYVSILVLVASRPGEVWLVARSLAVVRSKFATQTDI